MRSIINLLLVFSVAGHLSASVDPLDVLVMQDPTTNSVVVRTLIQLELATKMELKNARGNFLYSGDMTAGTYVSKRFSCDNLPTGRYVLYFTDERGRTSIPFSSRGGAIAFSAVNGLRTIFPAVSLSDDRTLIVSYHGATQEAYEIELLGADGRTVFTDSVRPSQATRKAYQLDNLHAGRYTLTFNTSTLPTRSTNINLR